MAKNYYIILGLDRGADAGQIKHAYRRIAKLLHPDRFSPSADAERFMEVKEAYDTLVDAERRRRYDDELTRLESAVRMAHASPVVPDHQRLCRGFERCEALADEFFEGWIPGFRTRPPRRRVDKDLYLEVILSARESREGGLFPIRFPVVEPCPRCHRGGLLEEFFCPVCTGRGAVSTERQFSLSIPPRTADGTSVSLSLEDIGLRDVHLHVAVHVDPWLEG